MLNRSNDYYEQSYKELRDYTEDNPLMELILDAYLRFRMENVLAPGADAWEAEQDAFEDAGDATKNGTGIEIYMPRFEKYLEYKGISREVVEHIDPQTPGRRQHGS